GRLPAVSRSPSRDVGDEVDDRLLCGPGLGGGQAVGRRGQLDGVGQALVGGDPLAHLVAGAGQGERVHHAVGDHVAEVVGAAPAAEGLDHGLLLGGQVVEGEEVGVAAHAGVEADEPGGAAAGQRRVLVDRVGGG